MTVTVTFFLSRLLASPFPHSASRHRLSSINVRIYCHEARGTKDGLIRGGLGFEGALMGRWERRQKGGDHSSSGLPNNLVGGLWAERLPLLTSPPLSFCFICCLLLLRSHPLSFFFNIIIPPCRFAHGVGQGYQGVGGSPAGVGGAGGGRSGPTGRACHVGFAVCLMFGGVALAAVVLLNVGDRTELMLCDHDHGRGASLGCGLSPSHPDVLADWLTVPCAVR